MFEEVMNLSNELNFNNLIYYFKSNSATKKFISFKDPLGKNIKDGIQHQEKQTKIKNN